MSWSLTGYQRKVERPWAHNLLKILGSEVPRSTAVLCTDSLVARPRGTKIRREVVLIRVLNSLGGNKDHYDRDRGIFLALPHLSIWMCLM